MALTFAGVPISDGNETPFDGVVESWLEWASENMRARNIFPLSINTWNGISEGGGYGPDKPVKPYVLYWPVNATRWAHMHVVVSERQLKAIRKAAPTGSATLKMTWLNQDSIVEDSISPTMTMLPAKPLSQLTLGLSRVRDDISEGLYLLSLVDDRYFWWLQQTPAIGTMASSFTWKEVFTGIMSSLGASASQDAVASVYDNPKVQLKDLAEFAPPAIDVACFYFGHRLTRSLSGSVKTKTPTNARTLAITNAEATAGAGFTRQGGGKFSLADIHNTYPSYIKLFFPRNDKGQYTSAITTAGPYSATGSTVVATAGTTAVALVVPPLIRLTGNGKTKHLLTTYEADYLAGSPANQATMDALLAQMASDYYLWTQPLFDLKFNGIVSLDPDGFHDIEWTYWHREVSTRMIPFKYEALFGPGKEPPALEPICATMGFGIGMTACFDADNPFSKDVCAEMGFGIGMTACFDNIIQRLEKVTTADISSSQNDYAWPSDQANVLYANVTADCDLTGITNGADGLDAMIVNVGTNTWTLKNAATSSAANQLNTPEGTDYPIKPKMGVILKYVGSLTKWVVMAASSMGKDQIQYNQIQNVSSADRVLGRGNGGGSGDIQECSLGNGLYFSGTTLSSYAGFGCLNAAETGTTTAALTTVRDTSYSCSVWSASIKNTGGSNSLDYSVVAYDADNNTQTLTGTIAPGLFVNFEATSLVWTTCRLPLIRMIIKVVDTIAASHTTYAVNMSYSGN